MYQRTIDSAIAQLEGIYGEELEWPTADQSYALNTIPDDEDYILHVTDDNCPRFKQVGDAVDADMNISELMS